ncbi:MAG: hypothetical protein AABY62_02585 [Pseudomonadota bacterium]
MRGAFGLVLGLAFAIPASAGALTLLSPAEGEIREVLITVPEEDFAGSEPGAVLREALAGIVRALGPKVRYLVHAYPARERAVTALMRRHGARELRFLPSAHGHYTRWPRDMLLVQRGGVTDTWLAPRALGRRLDNSVALEIGQQLGRRVQTIDGAVAGGNLVTAGGWVFAGEDLLIGDHDHRPERRVIERLLAPGQRWRWVAMPGARDSRAVWQGKRQPLFHLDLFLTALAPAHDTKPAVLVASPGLARRLLGQAPRASDRDNEYDGIAAALTADGFPVTRLPLLIESQGGEVSLLGHNNVLLEEPGPARRVFLPRYGGALAVLDEYAARVYRQHGYTIVWVEGPWRALARDLGGLRCLVLVTDRGPLIKGFRWRGRLDYSTSAESRRLSCFAWRSSTCGLSRNRV